MDIADFFQLQRAFQSHIIIQRTPDKKYVFIEAVLTRKGLDWIHILQSPADLRRDFLQTTHKLHNPLFRQRTANLCHIESEQQHYDELRRVRFRRCDGNLRPRPSIDDLICLSGDGRADDIRDRQCF